MFRYKCFQNILQNHPLRVTIHQPLHGTVGRGMIYEKSLKNYLYFEQNIRLLETEKAWECVSNENGTLFSGNHRTKMQVADLPEWYVRGRYYKRLEYLSAKGIADMVYIPSMFSNHFLKDDTILISYKGKITIQNEYATFYIDKYSGYDYCIHGIEILKGARDYSQYDIELIFSQITQKIQWLKEKIPKSIRRKHGRSICVIL